MSNGPLLYITRNGQPLITRNGTPLLVMVAVWPVGRHYLDGMVVPLRVMVYYSFCVIKIVTITRNGLTITHNGLTITSNGLLLL